MKLFRKLFLRWYATWRYEQLMGFPWWHLEHRITGRTLAAVDNNGRWETNVGVKSEHGVADPERKLSWEARQRLAKKTAIEALCR